jgi:hypothetical protein
MSTKNQEEWTSVTSQKRPERTKKIFAAKQEEKKKRKELKNKMAELDMLEDDMFYELDHSDNFRAYNPDERMDQLRDASDKLEKEISVLEQEVGSKS